MSKDLPTFSGSAHSPHSLRLYNPLSESLGTTLSQMSAVHHCKLTPRMFALNRNDGFVWQASQSLLPSLVTF